MRARTKSRQSMPERRSTSSAITHMLEVGWYQKRLPGSNSRRQREKRASRFSRLDHSCAG
jgi:hypothetical protein